MNFDEALEMIIDGLTDIEKYDEALDVIRTAGSDTTDSVYEQKYKELEAKYKQRFKEKMVENREKRKDNEDEKKEKTEREKISVEELDFSGNNE